jgi:hypothetical protein
MNSYHQHPPADSINKQIVESWLENKENNVLTNTYMITVARDGEWPPRSIYHFVGPLDAVNAYNEYKDWGFAKKFLTVRFYEPNGNVVEKTLRAPLAGECVFVRDQYTKIAEYLLEQKHFIPEKEYNVLINKLALLFSQDNWRFDPVRFFNNSGSSLTEAVE